MHDDLAVLQSSEACENMFSGMNDWDACQHSTDVLGAQMHFSRNSVVGKLRANPEGKIQIPNRLGSKTRTGLSYHH
jgi:hypothetical protein